MSNALRALARDKYICQYCGNEGLKSFESWNYTDVDHFDPTLPDEEVNELANLKTACRFCNLKKGKKRGTLAELRAFLIGEKIKEMEKYYKLKKKIRG